MISSSIWVRPMRRGHIHYNARLLCASVGSINSTLLSRTPTTAQLWQTRTMLQKSRGLEKLPTKQLMKRGKYPHESEVILDLPFFSDHVLRDQYVRFDGGVRFELILEDLDALAANVAFMHTDAGFSNAPTLSLVTAACDGVEMLRPFPMDTDLVMKGLVTYTGTSSMEVLVSIAPKQDPTKPLLESFFVMVAKDESTGKATPINPLLIPDGDDEAQWRAQKGAMHKIQRIAEAKSSLQVMEPSQEEIILLHKFMQKAKKNDRSTTGSLFGNQEPNLSYIELKDTLLESCTMTQPQDANTMNKIFGGYLMRKAFALARSNAYWFAGPLSHPTLLSIDDITFLRPVKIGSLIRFRSKVVYSEGSPTCGFLIRVGAEIMDLNTGELYTSNEFYFAFYSTEVALRAVRPVTYSDSMEYLDGRRRYLNRKLNALDMKSTQFKHY